MWRMAGGLENAGLNHQKDKEFITKKFNTSESLWVHKASFVKSGTKNGESPEGEEIHALRKTFR